MSGILIKLIYYYDYDDKYYGDNAITVATLTYYRQSKIEGTITITHI